MLQQLLVHTLPPFELNVLQSMYHPVETSQEHPDLIMDCATLTGAARVALGLKIPAVFCNDEELARDLLEQEFP